MFGLTLQSVGWSVWYENYRTNGGKDILDKWINKLKSGWVSRKGFTLKFVLDKGTLDQELREIETLDYETLDYETLDYETLDYEIL